MARYARAIVCALSLWLCLAYAGEDRREAKYTFVECELRDGTLVKGRLEAPGGSLALEASFGPVKVPFDRLSQIVVADDREAVTLHFPNGDRLSGFTGTDGLTVLAGETKTEIRFPELRRCDLRTFWAIPAKEPLKAEGATASGAWMTHTPQAAIDGDDDTFWNSGDWKGWLECDLGSAHKIVRIEIPLLFSPSGPAYFDVYASEKPIGASREGAVRLAHRAGSYQNGDALTVECPRDFQARYVQVSCTSSVSWFAVREMRMFPPEAKKK